MAVELLPKAKDGRSAIRQRMSKLGLGKKPVVLGKMESNVAKDMGFARPGEVRRFLLTSAQNNTRVNEKMWENLKALSDHYSAAIMVGTYTYNTNAYGEFAVKAGTQKEKITSLWYDERLTGHIVDQRVQLGNSLVWCGEMNILPTAVDPLSGLETFAHRKSAIFPHAKLAMRSVPVMMEEWAKQLFTTGTCTMSNYIQKKEGIKAEHHHSYSALIVEVNDKGNWWCRQIHFNSKTGEAQDLDVKVKNGVVTTGNSIEAINWGDLHATMVDSQVLDASMDMLDTLKPRVQFLHDVFEGAGFNSHQLKDHSPHYAYYVWKRGLHRVEEEVKQTIDIMQMYDRKFVETVVPDSNHDAWWLWGWLKRFDYRKDPGNARFFLDLQQFAYSRLEDGLIPKDISLLEYVLKSEGLGMNVRFLKADESYLVANGKIECGMHGHLGPNGARGTPNNLQHIGRRANTGHTHCPGIYNGLYVAGTSSKLKWSYNWGPSGWNNAHILTYPNGARTLVTLYDGKWRA